MTGLRVIDTGLWTTVQDAGPVGHRARGVPVGGAFDRRSAGLANSLIGNPADCAVLELTLRGGTFEADGTLGLAIAGAPIEAALMDVTGHPRPLRVPSSFTMRVCERLSLGRVLEGARTYLAVTGGFDMPVVMGSRSSETPLHPGDLLPAEESSTAARHLIDTGWSAPSSVPFRIVAGPDGSALPPALRWEDLSYRVGSQSNRQGLRLQGPPLHVRSDAQRLSAPVAPGAVQVAGAQPIVLGVAAGTIGGYPHVAHVISADLDRLGQLRPGDLVRFKCVTIAEARDLDRESRQAQWAVQLRTLVLAADRISISFDGDPSDLSEAVMERSGPG